MSISLQKSVFAVSLAASISCLCAGYAMAGQWIGVTASVILGALWLTARKYTAAWLPYLCLLVSQGLAVIGCLSNATPLLMIPASGLSLAAWDLALLNSALSESSYTAQTRRYEHRHIQVLLTALFASLFIAGMGHFLQLRVPFMMLVFLVGLFLFSLDRVWGSIKKTG